MERKEQILKAATKIFEKYGLAKTTLSDIAKECGIKKTAVYYYFKNKDEIIQTMFLRDIERLKAKVINEVQKQTTSIEKIRVYLIERTESIRFMMKYFDLFINEEAPLQHREFALNEKRAILKEEVNFLKDIIEEGKKNEEIKNINTMSLIYLLLGSTHDLGLEQFFYHKDLDIQTEIESIMEILLNGIRR